MKNLEDSDVCLGVFGSTLKAKKVLTNKVSQILASKKPLITMNSPAAEESNLKSQDNCVLVPPSCPEKLAEAILFLKNNPEERKQIAFNGNQSYEKYFSMNVVGNQLVKIINDLTKISD